MAISARSKPPSLVRTRRLTLVAGLVGLALTAVLTWVAFVVDHNSNTRLLQLQVKETAVALSLSEVPTELADALQVATATNSAVAFDRFDAGKIGPGQLAEISLWRRNGTALQLVAHVGPTSGLTGDTPLTTFLSRVHPDTQLEVTSVLPGNPRHVGFAEMAPGDHEYIVFAEGVLPPVGYRMPVPKNSPFSDLNIALYLGRSVRASQLLEATVPTPLHGATASATVPYGDSELLLVGSAKTDLAGGFTAALPWIALGIGLVLTLASVSTLDYVLRRRDVAEALANEASVLADENERLYLEQRNIAGTLQHALLPELPTLDRLEVAARYLPGTAGVEVGGDWFDVIHSSTDRCVVIVGDVSGRGLRAATTMAALRYAARAYVAEGHRPEAILAKLGQILSFDVQQQFATMLIGEIDLTNGRLCLANAGHLPPLLLAGAEASFIEMPSGRPVGLNASDAPLAIDVQLAKGAAIFAFTDGLVERRGEHLDTGLERIRVALAHQRGSMEDIVDRLVTEVLREGFEDDVAIVGVRWRTETRASLLGSP